MSNITLRKVVRTASILLLAGAVFIGASAFADRASAADLSGCWSGSWESCKSGHHGPLRASFSRCNDSQYLVTFSGRFFKLFPFRYTVTLDVIEESGDNVKLSGSSYLGRMFGTFTYSAEVNGGEFNSSYNSCKDNGWFRLSKCCD